MPVKGAVTRPVLRYMGGKWRMAPRLIALFPHHRVYVEPFGGAGSVLLRKDRSYAEIYNDLDGEIVNLFRVLQDRSAAADLIHRITYTAFAREEFEASYVETDEPVERARRLVVRSFMGHGATAVALRRRTGFRADSNRSGTTPAMDWANLPHGLAQAVERLRGVVIENRPAADLIARFGKEADVLIYADPPYLHDTRSRKRVRGALEHAYSHEMSVADHQALLEQLKASPAMVVLSGYASRLYDEALEDWRRVTFKAMADGARPRTEVVWLNPACVAALPTLFDEGLEIELDDEDDAA